MSVPEMTLVTHGADDLRTWQLALDAKRREARIDRLMARLWDVRHPRCPLHSTKGEEHASDHHDDDDHGNQGG